MEVNEKILVYGALLHDVGKAIQRAKGMSKDHPTHGAEFVKNEGPSVGLTGDEIEKISFLVGNHHNKDVSDPLLDIIKEADWSSARYNRKKYQGEDPPQIATTPLLTIFSEIEIEGKGAKEELYNPVQPLNFEIKKHYPKKRGSPNIVRYTEIKNSLERDWKKLHKIGDTHGKIDTINYIFLKNFKFVPSAIYKSIPDIPLYDHLKTTAAIALSLYRGEKNKPYLLIGGEISGIQKFIFYNVNAKESDAHAAKRFRGRSFFINLFTDSVVKYIMHELDLYEFSVIVNTAGHFVILAPNTEENRRKLEKVRYEINNYIVKEEIPGIYMSMAWVEFAEDGFEGFKVLSSLYQKIGERKLHKFSETIKKNDNFFKEEIEINPCPSCGRNRKEEKCEFCESLEKIGEKLVKTRYLLRKIGNKKGDWTFQYGDTSITYLLLPDIGQKNKDDFADWEVFDIRNIEIPEFGCVRGFKLLGGFAPKIEIEYTERVLSFEELVRKDDELYERVQQKEKEREKDPKLAIFKADVDNLGLIFKKGIKEMSISRYSHLSFMLDAFFALEGSKTAESNNIYLLFAGGDDLSAIGRYDEILKFAEEIEEKFKEWCGFNPALSLSGGVAIADVKFPVRRLVHYGEEELSKSKTREKNKITMFDISMPWDKFREQIKLACKLEEYRKNKWIAGGFSHFLIELYEKSPDGRGYPREIVHPRPYLEYYLKRNFRGGKENRKVRDDLIEKILDKGIFPYIKAGASIWALNRRYFPEKEVKICMKKN